ncbi:unnamed protein product [Penicillium roqueforti FM164]|uniref:Uncharacterized protein n=1 Tax=Penicillium roqueforti (strain FM164) TaxID=1365484 RepID=W6QM28_PENRF|nr:unnamed protein product [Penicillium roqueforti FM164]
MQGYKDQLHWHHHLCKARARYPPSPPSSDPTLPRRAKQSCRRLGHKKTKEAAAEAVNAASGQDPVPQPQAPLLFPRKYWVNILPDDEDE